MIFNLTGAPNPHTFADVKIGEGFFSHLMDILLKLQTIMQFK